MNYTAAQMELVAHIEAQNAKALAWVAEDPTNRAVGITVTDPAHWAEYGIFSVDQYEHYMASMSHYDVFKRVHGFRPRHIDYDAMTTEEIMAEVDRMLTDEENRIAEEKREYRKTVARLTKELGVDEKTLKRWKVI